MSWFFLIVAGLLETVWSSLLKHMSGGVTLPLLAALIVSMGGSFYLLLLAMRGLPLSVAYPVWTGIGSASAVLVGFLWFGETLSVRVIAGVVLLIAGMALLSSETI